MHTEVKGMKKYLSIIIFLILGIFLFLIAVYLFRAQKTSGVIGERMAPFSLTSFTGKTINIEDYYGKVMVINFWASWCVTCAEEAEYLEYIWQEYKPSEKVIVLGIDYVDTEKEAQAYLQKYAISYPNGADLGMRISNQFRVRGVPETYIIDKTGKIAFIKIGPYNTVQELRSVIDDLLEG